MPIMPSRLPRRDVAGLDKPRSDRMNSGPAPRYNNADRLAFIREPPRLSSSANADDPVTTSSHRRPTDRRVLDAPLARGMTTYVEKSPRRSLRLLLVHREHSLSDQEAAEDVHAG